MSQLVQGWGDYDRAVGHRAVLRRGLVQSLDVPESRVDRDVILLGCPCPLVAPDRPKMICELAAGVV